MTDAQTHMTHGEAATDPMLVVDHVTKTFGPTKALNDVHFFVPRGSFTVLLGPAGAGKTTTLRTIAGLDKPDTGEIILDGRDVGRWEPKDRNLAMIFDNLALYPNKTGYQNIASPLAIARVSKEEVKERVQEIGAMLQITRILDRLPKTMSGGERQRVALGRALIRTPNMFLLDEPLSSLDAKLRIELRAELRKLQRDHGRTFLMATPDYNEALAIADTVIMLREGKVVQEDKPQIIYDLPVDREAALFVGSPQINILPARYEQGAVRVAGVSLDAPDHFKAIFGDGPADFDLGVRPENLALTEGTGHMTAKLLDIEALGLKSALTVHTDGDAGEELRLMVDSTLAHTLSVGQTVAIDAVNTFLMLAFDRESGLRLTPQG